MAECVISGCDGYRKSRLGYCEAHYKRHIRGVDVTTPIKRYGNTIGTCTAPDCDLRTSRSRLCAGHYTQSVRGREFTPLRSIHDELGYDSAHFRPRQLWGSASRYLCVDCGRGAKEWAYDGTDPSQLLGQASSHGRTAFMFYSRYPEFYLPMCKSCHQKRDQVNRQQELNEYRAWKHEAGIALSDIPISIIREVKSDMNYVVAV